MMKKILNYLSIILALTFGYFGNTTIASIVVVNGLSHEHAVSTGTNVQGAIEIKNASEESARVRIYKSDVIHNCDGNTVFDITTDRDRCSNDWMRLAGNELTLQANQTINLTYELNPGSDVNPVGTYWGVIMIEELDVLDTLAPQAGVKVNSIIRYAVQIISNFSNDAVKELAFEAINIDTVPDKNVLLVSINNVGNYMLKPIVVLELYNEYGEQVGRKELPFQKVYPGYCRRFSIPLEEIKSGAYSAILVADCGEDNLFGLNFDIEVKHRVKD